MFRTSFTSAESLGGSAADAYTLPGQWIISAVSPILNSVVGDKALLLSLLLSTVVWFLLLAVAFAAFSFARRVAANMRTAVRARWFSIKTRWACFRRSPKSRRQSAASDAEVQFDNLDLAVLNSAATLGPGFALTAPDLAEEFKLRPRQVQHSLEKLAKNMMLERGFGADEDYQNYRLSQGGAAFLSMWKRKRT